MTAAHTWCGSRWAHGRNQGGGHLRDLSARFCTVANGGLRETGHRRTSELSQVGSIIVTTSIASPPAGPVPIVPTAPAVASAGEPPRARTIERPPASSFIAGLLEDMVLLVGAVFLFPLIILLAGSPFALLAKAIAAAMNW